VDELPPIFVVLEFRCFFRVDFVREFYVSFVPVRCRPEYMCYYHPINCVCAPVCVCDVLKTQRVDGYHPYLRLFLSLSFVA
jgi:hypothetical protein